jgi:hypothetical protein
MASPATRCHYRRAGRYRSTIVSTTSRAPTPCYQRHGWFVGEGRRRCGRRDRPPRSAPVKRRTRHNNPAAPAGGAVQQNQVAGPKERTDASSGSPHPTPSPAPVAPAPAPTDRLVVLVLGSSVFGLILPLLWLGLPWVVLGLILTTPALILLNLT